MDDGVGRYLARVVKALEVALGENLEAVWMSGSTVTGDFHRSESDLDVLVVCRRSISSAEKDALAGGLRHAALPCPALGLDLLVYPADEVRTVPRSPRYDFSLASGRSWSDEISLGGPYPGGILDLALVRVLGVALWGPEPQTTVGPIPDPWIIEELAGSLRWHTTRVHDPFHDPTGANAVLNACRALCYRSGGSFVSKSDGARWLLGARHVPVVAAALTGRVGNSAPVLDRAAVLSFLAEALEEFET